MKLPTITDPLYKLQRRHMCQVSDFFYLHHSESLSPTLKGNCQNLHMWTAQTSHFQLSATLLGPTGC